MGGLKIENPFKMKWPQIGAGIATGLTLLMFGFLLLAQKYSIFAIFLLPYIVLEGIFNLLTNWFLKCPVKDMGLWHSPSCGVLTLVIGITLMTAVFGFLLGWIIQLLIFKFKKNKQKV